MSVVAERGARVLSLNYFREVRNESPPLNIKVRLRPLPNSFARHTKRRSRRVLCKTSNLIAEAFPKRAALSIILPNLTSIIGHWQSALHSQTLLATADEVIERAFRSAAIDGAERPRWVDTVEKVACLVGVVLLSRFDAAEPSRLGFCSRWIGGDFDADATETIVNELRPMPSAAEQVVAGRFAAPAS